MSSNINSETPCLNMPNSWGWVNDVLYRMCNEEPEHTSLDVIAGKVLLIGRAYSAAIERRAGERLKKGLDKYYFEDVATAMYNSNIDIWIKAVTTIERVTSDNVGDVLHVHKQVTDLFEEISSNKKRSLASKYLHFHQPKAFFIFDSRANAKIRALLKGQKFDPPTGFDDPYAEFVYRCMRYRDNVFEPMQGRQSTPRELDRHLLGY